MTRNLLLIGALVLLCACPTKEKYPTGFFTTEVSNLRKANTSYDDYNSDLPALMYRHVLQFSSNRNTAGREFDIVAPGFYVTWLMETGTLNIDVEMTEDPYGYVEVMLDSVNTPCDELGPYSVGYQHDQPEFKFTDIMLYANNCEGNYDIRYVVSRVTSPEVNELDVAVSSPAKLAGINTDANELYPTFYGDGFDYLDEMGPKTDKIEKMLYCSDKDGSFDLYEVDVALETDILGWLSSDGPLTPVKLGLSSAGNDKCPFVNGKLMVFASDREGGFGGFDLYYSKLENDSWSDPVNFGAEINTEHDEYRPVVLHYPQFENNLLIFSSNRPGGNGGFDLYQTGINVSTE